MLDDEDQGTGGVGLGAFAVQRVDHAGVGVGGDRDGGVAEGGLDVFEVRAGGLQIGRGAVPQVVQPDRGQPGGGHQTVEAVADGVGMPRLPTGLHEEQPGVRPGRAGHQPVGCKYLARAATWALFEVCPITGC